MYDQARMRGKRVYPPYSPYSHGNFSHVIFKALPASEIPALHAFSSSTKLSTQLE